VKSENIPVTIKKVDDETWEVSSDLTGTVVTHTDPTKLAASIVQDLASIKPIPPMSTPSAKAAMVRFCAMMSNPKTNKIGNTNPDYSVKSMLWMFDTLTDAPIYWVSAEMTDLLSHAVPTMPPTTMTTELLPHPNGIIFFEKPFMGKDARSPNSSVVVQAMAWGQSHFDVQENIRHEVVTGEGYPVRFVGNGVSISTWRHFEYWMPLGRTDWPFGTDTEAPFAPAGFEPYQLESIIEDRRLFAAFLLLSQQRGITDVTEQTTPRHIAKQLARSLGVKDFKNIPSPKVRLVDIHKHHHPIEKSDETRHIEWSKRWWVGAHWRQQAYGPGRKLRRPLLIMPYIKGPEDKPLADPSTIVRVWRDVR
jgi:hypothetical protein